MGKFDETIVETFERLRPMREHPGHLVGGQINIVEAEHDQAQPARARHELERGAERDCERAFGARDRARQVKAVFRQELVEIVARDAPRDFREPLTDAIAVAIAQYAERRDQRRAPAVIRDASGRAGCTKAEPRAVVEHDLHRREVVGGFAVGGRMRAAGVIADHPADRASIFGRRIGREEQALSRERGVEMTLHHARLNDSQPPRGIDTLNRVHVFGEVEHQGGVAGLTGKARASAAREHRHRVLARQRQRIEDVALVARDDDPERDAPIVRRVGRVDRLRGGVEAHLALHPAA